MSMVVEKSLAGPNKCRCRLKKVWEARTNASAGSLPLACSTVCFVTTPTVIPARAPVIHNDQVFFLLFRSESLLAY